MTRFHQSLYSDTSLDELVTYSIQSLLEENQEATFENSVAKCYGGTRRKKKPGV